MQEINLRLAVEDVNVILEGVGNAIWDGYAEAVTSGNAAPLVLRETRRAQGFCAEAHPVEAAGKFWKKKEEKLCAVNWDARGSDATWLRKAAKDWVKRVNEDFAEFCSKPE